MSGDYTYDLGVLILPSFAFYSNNYLDVNYKTVGMSNVPRKSIIVLGSYVFANHVTIENEHPLDIACQKAAVYDS